MVLYLKSEVLVYTTCMDRKWLDNAVRELEPVSLLSRDSILLEISDTTRARRDKGTDPKPKTTY